MTRQTENKHFTELAYYRQVQLAKKTMIISEEDVLTHPLALLPPPLIFGRIPKCFDTAV